MGLKTEKITIEIDIIPVERYIGQRKANEYERQISIQGTNYRGIHFYFSNEKGILEYVGTDIFGINVVVPQK